MPMKTTAQLRPGDVIETAVKADTVYTEVVAVLPIHGSDKSRKKQRVTDIQVKVRQWPNGTALPVFVWPVTKMWKIIKDARG